MSRLAAYIENSSDAFRRLRRRGEAPEKLAASPRSLTISSFSNELIITHFRKFFKQKFSDLAANSFLSFKNKKDTSRIINL